MSRAGTLCLSFDNLGEASEIELGAVPASPGAHPTVTEALPAILGALADRELRATFFIEGLNAELYPEALAEIDARGHEVAFHAWRHEQWAGLDAAAQADNLARGIAAFAELDLRASGMRPPGGGLGPGGTAVLREAGLRYCSPAGPSSGVKDGVAVLPFEWPHVDAGCVLSGLGPSREPAEFLEFLEAELAGLAREGGLLTIVLHPFMLEWFGVERLSGLLDAIVAARESGDIRVERCEEAAERLLSAP